MAIKPMDEYFDSIIKGINNNGNGVYFHCNLEWHNGHYRCAFREMTEELFFATYKTLLPVIRNLYSK